MTEVSQGYASSSVGSIIESIVKLDKFDGKTGISVAPYFLNPVLKALEIMGYPVWIEMITIEEQKKYNPGVNQVQYRIYRKPFSDVMKLTRTDGYYDKVDTKGNTTITVNGK